MTGPAAAPPQDWQEITLPPYFEQPQTLRRMVPVWRFIAHYAGPDGMVPEPAAYMNDDGVMDWVLRRQETVSTDDKRAARRTYAYFQDRHLDPRGTITYPAWDQNAPRPVSNTHGDSDKDLDILLTFRQKILDREGLTATSPPEELARAFALELYQNWRGGGPHNHPGDVLTHRAWCLGAEITTGALLRSLGIPVRGARTSDHAVCEVLLNDRWQVIDSSNHFINHEPRSIPFLPTNFMDLTTDPCSPAHGDQISDYHRGFFYHFPRAHYGIPDNRWIEQALLYLCPATARALYPGLSRYRFKTQNHDQLRILDRNTRFLYRYDLAHNLMPGETLREAIYIGDTADTTGFTFELRFLHLDGLFPKPDVCRHLVLRVGDLEIPLDQAAWPMEPDQDRTARLAIPIPSASLTPNCVNTCYLENRSRGHIFRFPVTISLLDSNVPPLLPAG